MSERVAAQPEKTLSRPNTPAASGLLQRKCACGSGGAANLTGACDDCSRKRLRGLQSKLEVGQPGDSFEQEADRVADEVMRQRAPAPSQNMNAPAGGGVQRKTITPVNSSASAARAVSAPPIVEDALNSPGQPLDAPTRSFMESRFGHDFGRVRVHTDAIAQKSAQAVDSLAYTVGHNVVFAAGQYAPRTGAGQRLLAHELTHVLQQSGTQPGGTTNRDGGAIQRQAAGGGGVLQRQPAPASRKVRILSLDEINADPKRREALKLSGLAEAKVCRDISVPFTNQKCPTALKPNTEVTIVGSAAGGAWLKLACAGIPGFGDKEQCYVPNVFAKDVPVVMPEKPKPAPVAAERPKEEPAAAPAAAAAPKEEALWQRAKKRLEGLPAKTKWKGKPGRAFTAISYAIVARDFWFNEPKDQEAAATILRNVRKNFSDVYLTDSNFDKRFGEMNGFTRTSMRNFLLAGRSGFKRLVDLTIPGIGMNEPIWDVEIKRLMAAHEVMEVLAGDLEAKESKNIKALDDVTSLKPATAFLDGLLEGFKSELSEEDYKVLAAKLAGSQVVSYFAPSIIAGGAAVGIAKDIGEAFKGIAEMIEKPAEMAENMAVLLSTLMFDEEGARVMGQAMGAEHGKEIHKLASENIVKFTYKLGELIGPTVVYTVLSIVSAGAIAGAAVSARLSKFLVKFPKAAKTIDRIKGLMPKGRTARAAEKAAEEAGDAKAAAGKAKALSADAPDKPKVPAKPDAPDKPKAPEGAAKAADADGGAARKPDQDKAPDGKTPPGKKIVAEEAADGHTYKVLEDGTIIRCSDCGPLRHRIEDFSAAHPKAKGLAELQKELAEIEAIADPKVKARRASQLDKKLKATMSQHKPGAWQDDFSVNNMSKDAAAYQSRVTGAKPGKGYYVNDVQFDGFDKGKLVDAKYFTNDGRFMRDTWYQFNKAWSILDDAKRQLKAAGGMPIEWRVAGKEPAKLIRQLFATHDIPIKVVHWP